MKSILIILLITLSSSVIISQSKIDSTDIQFREAGLKLQSAGTGIKTALLLSLLGTGTSVVLALTLKKEDGTISPLVSIPAILGYIFGFVSYLDAARDLEKAGEILKNIKRIR